MHELGIAAAALEQTLAQARRHDAQRIVRIVLRVGELSGVDPEALQFAFAALLPDSPAAGAEVEIRSAPGIATCSRCQRSYPTSGCALAACPDCGSPPGAVTGGRELELVQLEID